MDYREYVPSTRLAPFVARLWTLTGSAMELGEGAQPILPDGRPELVMHFGDPFVRKDASGVAERQPLTLLAGQMTAQLTLEPTGAVAVLGIRFHPFGAAAFLHEPMHRLNGLTIGVDAVSPSLARALEAVRSATDDVRIAAPIVQRVLEDTIDDAGPEPRIASATRMILESGGTVAIDRLAKRVSMTRRHLERRFLSDVGIGPKRLARIARFQRALGVLETADPDRRGAITAAACGYADQAHFMREFRALAGCSPAQHLVTHGELTGFFVTRSRVSSPRR
jgi:AraC-like DNA-binding protein